MTIESKVDYKSPMYSGVDLMKTSSKELYYVAMYFSGYQEEAKMIMVHILVFLEVYYEKISRNTSMGSSE